MSNIEPRYITDTETIPEPEGEIYGAFVRQPEPVFTEAPAVVFTQLYGKKGGQVIQFNLTCRGNTGTEAIDQIMAAIRYAGERYKLSVDRPDVSVAAPERLPEHPATLAAQQAQPAPVAQPAPAPASAAPASPANVTTYTAPGAGNTIHAVRLEVVPNASGKVTLRWYEAGHNYPDITTTRTVEKAAELLASTGEDWKPEHMRMVQQFTVRHVIRWRASEKMNTQGKPYKDIVSIVSEA